MYGPLEFSIPFIAGQWSLRGVGGVVLQRVAAVSIPFIAGQWSLPGGEDQMEEKRQVSIPFIAGQWSLRPGPGAGPAPRACFNPLHCGAVVASRRELRRALPGGTLVSIPFIAGQWSLLARITCHEVCLLRFNPLHCGAVVASLSH